jgi:hypothetical protein
MKRQTDRLWAGATIGGFLILVGTLILRYRGGLGETSYTIGLVLGAGMLAPNFVLDLVRRYLSRSRGGPR